MCLVLCPDLRIVIDEGHLLGKEMLEEIRFLTNFRMDSYTPTSLILLGQPELRRILQMQIYEAIVQRVNVRFHLPGMDQNETAGYIGHHLKIAGVQNQLFTESTTEWSRWFWRTSSRSETSGRDGLPVRTRNMRKSRSKSSRSNSLAEPK